MPLAPRTLPSSVLLGLVLLGTWGCGDPSPTTPGAPDATQAEPVDGVVLFTIDTLRADRLSPWAELSYATPGAARLARQALVFERAYSQADNTHPAVTSFLTGLVPPRHGVTSQVSQPRHDIASLASMLSTQGVATGSFVANLCKLQDVAGSVFSQGWNERFCGMDDALPQHVWGTACVDEGMAWIERQRAEGKPFFAWIHLMDPHSEYDPLPAYWDHPSDPVRPKIPQLRYYSAFEETRKPPPAADLERLNALYDAEVEGSDHELGRMLDFLDALPGGDRVALILSADHGEELYETWHRIGHGFSLTEGVLHVPLMIRAPGVAPGRVAAPVETLAITPTILGLFDARAPYELDARSLLAGAPALPYARSFTEPLVVTLRAGDKRVWLRGVDEIPHREEAAWRLEAPWFEQPECLASYDPSAPTLPVWGDPTSEGKDGPFAVLRAAARRVLSESRASSVEPAEITDSAYLEQLIELGYIERPER